MQKCRSEGGAKNLLWFLVLAVLFGTMPAIAASERADSPQVRRADVFDAQWDHRPQGRLWSRTATSALYDHGLPLLQLVPRDVDQWCRAYEGQSKRARAAFWVGFLSALARYESTWRAEAVGGSGRWFGLLQISPATARGYGCRARTGSALLDGPDNLSCAIRIMARTVARDGVIHAQEPKWSGVSADWGPMRSTAKRKAMARWLQSQSYCQLPNAQRPQARP